VADSVQLSFEGLLEQLASPLSKRAYAADWARYTAWLETEKVAVIDVKPRHVVAHIGHLRAKGYSKATIGRALSVIREVYAALVRDEIIETNPAREVKNIKMGAEPRAPVLSEEQMTKLLNLPRSNWTEERAHVCMCLLFGLGWRRSEIAALKLEDFRDGTVTGVIKGSKPLTVGVPEWVQEAIDDWCALAGITEGALLPRSETNHEAVSGDMVYTIVRDAAERVELKAPPHAFRRANITLGGERGVSLKARQLAVGHSSQATTERYDKARDAAKNAPGQVFADMLKKNEKRDE